MSNKKILLFLVVIVLVSSSLTILSAHDVSDDTVLSDDSQEQTSTSDNSQAITKNVNPKKDARTETKIEADNIKPVEVGRNLHIEGQLLDVDNNPLSNKNIRIGVKNSLFDTDSYEDTVTTNSMGTYSCDYQTTMVTDWGIVTIDFDGDELYLPSSYGHNYELTFQVTQPTIHEYSIDIMWDQTKTIYVNDNVELTGRVYDLTFGENVSNAPVTLKIDDQNISLTTQANGSYSYNYTPQEAKTVSLEVIYDEYPDTKYTTTLVVEAIPQQDTLIILYDRDGTPYYHTSGADGLLVMGYVGSATTFRGRLVTTGGMGVASQIIEFEYPSGYNLTTDEDGYFTYSYVFTDEIFEYYSVNYHGSSHYSPSESGYALYIEELVINYELEVDIDSSSIDLYSTLHINGSLHMENSNMGVDDVDVTIRIYNNQYNKTFTTTTSNGGFFAINYAADKVGIFNVEASSELTGTSMNNPWFEVDKLQTSLSVNDFIMDYVLEEANITGTLTTMSGMPLDNQTIQITINNHDYTTKTVNGNFSFNYTPESPGSYTILFDYGGNENFYGCEEVERWRDVSLLSTILTVNATNVSIYENTTITGTLKAVNGRLLSNQEVSIKVGTSTFTTTTDDNGCFNTTYHMTNAGNFTVTANFTSQYYLSSANTTNITVFKRNLTIVPDGDVFTSKLNDTIRISFKLLDNGEVTVDTLRFTMDDYVEDIIITSSHMTYTLNKNISSGLYTYTLVFDGDDTYYNTSATGQINITPINTVITQDESIISTADVFENVTLGIVLMDENNNPLANQLVKFYYNNTLIANSTTDSNGRANITTTFNTTRDTTIVAVYENSTDYIESNATLQATISQVDSNTTITVPEFSFIGHTVKINITLTHDDKPISGREVTITVNDNDSIQETTNENGIITIDYYTTIEEDVVITAKFIGDDTYNPSNDTKQFPVVNGDTQLIITPAQQSVYVDDEAFITINLTNNDLAIDANVTITINDGDGVVLDLTKTNTFSLPTTHEGNYLILVVYNGTERYNKTNQTADYTVNKLGTTLGVENNYLNQINDVVTFTVNLTDVKSSGVTEGEVVLYYDDGRVLARINMTESNSVDVTFNNTYDSIINAKYFGTDKYINNTATTDLQITRINTILTLDSISTTKITENVTITGTLTDNRDNKLSNTNITLTINGEDVNITTNDSGGYNYTYTTVTAGLNNITVKFRENATHNASTNKTQFTVEKLDTNIIINNIGNAKYSQNITITGSVMDENHDYVDKENVTIKVNNQIYTVPLDEGAFNISYLADKVGTNNVTVTFNTTSKYSASKANTTFNVAMLNTEIRINPVSDARYNDTVTLTATIYDEFNNTLANTNIILKINDEETTLKSNDAGLVNYTFTADTVGLNTILMEYPQSEAYNYTQNTTTFTISKLKTKIVFEEVNPVKYGENLEVTARLLDENDHPLTNQVVHVKINEQASQMRRSNENATIRFTMNANTLGTNNITMTYNGTSNYENTTNKTTFECIQLNTQLTITMPDSTKYNSTMQVQIKLSDEKARTIANQDVTVKINGQLLKTYKTSNNGLIVFNIIANKTGLNSIEAVYESNNTYNSSNATQTFTVTQLDTTITINTISDKKLGDNLTISGRLVDEEDNPIQAMITLTVNGQNITVTTNTDGLYTKNITAAVVGTNTIIAQFNANENYTSSRANTTFNVAKLKTTITIDSVNDKKVGDTVIVNARLVDERLDAIQASVKLIVNNKTTTLTTDSNGQITTNFTAQQVGLNNITIVFDADNEYESSNNSVYFNTTKLGTNIELNNIANTKIGDEIVVSGIIRDERNNPVVSSITIKLGSDTYTVTTDSMGAFTKTLKTSQVGLNNVTATFAGNDKYESSNASTKFNVDKFNTLIVLDSIGDVKVTDEIVFSGIIRDERGNPVVGNLNLAFNKNNYTVTSNSSGAFSKTFSTSIVGTNNVTVKFNSNDKYESSNASTTFNVDKFNTLIVLDSIGDVKVTDEIVVSGIIRDERNKAVVANLTLTFNNKTYTIKSNSSGAFSMTFSTSIVGTNNVTVKFNSNDKYESSNASTTFNVDKFNTLIVLDGISDVKVTDEIVVSGIIRDDRGNPVVGNLNLAFNKNNYTVTSNSSGAFSKTFSTSIVGTNNVTIKFNSNDKYESSNASTTFNVDKFRTKTVIYSIFDVKVDDIPVISGIVLDERNNPVKATVKLVINGVAYNVETNNQAIFTKNYKANTSGLNNVTAIFSGNAHNYPSNASTTFNVNKYKTSISIDSIANKKVDDLVTVTVRVLDEANNKINTSINLTINSVSTTKKVTNGVFTYNMTASLLGKNNITATVIESYKYNPSSIKVSFNVSKLKTTLSLNPINDKKVGDAVNITGRLVDERNNSLTANITLKYNSRTRNISVINGSFTAGDVAEVVGLNNVTVTMPSNSKYESSTNKTTFNVSKLKTKLTIDQVSSNKYGDNVTVRIRLVDERGSNITAKVNLTVNSDVKEVSIVNGVYEEKFKATTVGLNNITAKYAGDNKYSASSNKTSFNTTKLKTTLILDKITDKNVGDTINITGKLVDENNRATSSKIILTINNRTSTITTNAAGQFKYTTQATLLGVNNISVAFNFNSSHEASTNKTSFTVSKLTTTLSIDSISDKKVGDNVAVTLRLRDQRGNPVLANITLTFNNQSKVYSTNSAGIRVVNFTVSKLHTNNISAVFSGNNKYAQSRANTSFDVSKLATRFILDNISQQKYANNITVNATLLDERNNPLKNTSVVLIVNGKNKTIQTNTNGVCSDVVLISSVGTNSITLVYPGDNKYESSNVTKVFDVNKLNTVLSLDSISDARYNDTVKVRGRLLDERQNALSGYNVGLTVNGNVQTLKTDSNGVFSTSLVARVLGTNNVTASFTGVGEYNGAVNTSVKFNVRRIATNTTVSPISARILDRVDVIVGIVDEDKKSVSSGSVQFKIGDKLLTDDNGNVVRVNVNNGTAVYNYLVPTSLRDVNTTIMAIYSGSDMYLSSMANSTVRVAKRDARIVVCLDKLQYRGGDHSVISTVVVDRNNSLVDGGIVLFKLNGETIKDSNGQSLNATVKNGVATLNYRLPEGISAKNINLSAVFVNSNYNRVENDTILSILRSNVIFEPSIVVAKSDMARFTARLVDANGVLVSGESDVAIKINGRTVKRVTITNGVLNTTLDVSSYAPGVYTVEYMAGMNNRYNSVRTYSIFEKV